MIDRPIRMSDRPAGRILQVTAAGEILELRQFGGTAELACIPENSILIVPHRNESEVVAHDVSDDVR